MKKTDKQLRRHRTRRSLTAIGLLAIGAGVSLAHLPEAQAYQVAISSGDQAALEQFLRDHPTSSYAPDVIGRLLLGVHKTDSALPESIQLAGNAGGKGGGNGGHGGGNGGGHGGGNGGGHGGGNGGGNGGNGGGHAGGNDGGHGGGQGNGGGHGGGSGGAKTGSDSGDGPNNGHANGGNGHFHGEGDQGRPDMFGGPGTPDIGPPGLSGY